MHSGNVGNDGSNEKTTQVQENKIQENQNTNTKRRDRALRTKRKMKRATQLKTKTLLAIHHLLKKQKKTTSKSTKDAEANMQKHSVPNLVAAKASLEANSNSSFTRRREMDESSTATLNAHEGD